MTEAEIQRDILVKYGARPGLRLWRENTGAAKIGGRFIRFGVPGRPDIQGVWNGRYLAIEVKRPGGVQSAVQKTFQAAIEACGGIYVLAYSVADVARILGE